MLNLHYLSASDHPSHHWTDTLDESCVVVCASDRLKQSTLSWMNAQDKSASVISWNELVNTDVAPSVSQEGIEKSLLSQCIQNGFRHISSQDSQRKSVIDSLYQLIKTIDRRPKKAPIPGELKSVLSQFKKKRSAHNLQSHSEQHRNIDHAILDTLLGEKKVHIIGFYTLSWAQLDWLQSVLSVPNEWHFWIYHDLKSPPAQQLVHHLLPISTSQFSHTPPQHSIRRYSYSAKSIADEIQFICQSIESLLQTGVDANAIGVVLPNMQRYKLVLETASNNAPFQLGFPTGHRFAHTSLALAIHHAFNLIEFEFSWVNALKFLSNPLVKKWDRIYMRDALIDEFSQTLQHTTGKIWLDEWRDAMSYWKNRDDSPWDIEQLTIQHQLLCSLYDWWEWAQAQDTADGIAAIVTDLQTRLSIATNAKDPILIQTTQLLRQANHSLNQGTKGWLTLNMSGNLQILCHHFRLMMDNLTFVIPDDGHRPVVRVTSAKEALMQQKSHVFILGLLDPQWFSHQLDTSIFSRNDLHDMGIPTEDDHYNDTHYLLSILASSARYVTLSYPAHDNQKPLSPSHFLVSLPDVEPILEYDLVYKTDKMQQIIDGQHTTPSIPSYSDGDIGSVVSTSLPPLSPTALEQYQACPYHYFLKKYLRCADPSPNTGIFSPQEWGILIHALLHNTPSFGKDALYATAATLLDEMHLAPFRRQFAQNKLFGTDGYDGLLDWIVDDDKNSPYQLSTIAKETKFGPKDEGSDEKNEKESPKDHTITRLGLKGQIDAILSSHQGEVVILDYKTGKKIPTRAELSRFESLQLPIYMLAAKALYPEKEIVGAVIHQVHNSSNHGRHVLACTKKSKDNIFDLGRKRPLEWNDEFAHQLQEHLVILKESIEQGDFSVYGPKKLPHFEEKRSLVCQRCNFKRVCRYPKRFNKQ